MGGSRGDVLRTKWKPWELIYNQTQWGGGNRLFGGTAVSPSLQIFGTEYYKEVLKERSPLAALPQQSTANLIHKKVGRDFRRAMKWLIWILLVEKPTYLEKKKITSSFSGCNLFSTNKKDQHLVNDFKVSTSPSIHSLGTCETNGDALSRTITSTGLNILGTTGSLRSKVHTWSCCFTGWWKSNHKEKWPKE